MSPLAVLSPMLRRFEALSCLSEDDRKAVLGLPYRLRSVSRDTHFVREGERVERSCLLLSGFAFRQKLTFAGARQILSIHIPGDFVDLQGALLNRADHNVQALTRCELATIARADIRALACERPTVALAMWIDTLIDASIFREWIVNIGRRDAQGRIAHLLCEFGCRLEAAGLSEACRYEMPMSQIQMADAAGITSVHVNRVLRELDRSGIIARNYRSIIIRDWDALCRIADFNDSYLHLDQVSVEKRQAA